jgi:hypothetical protein
MMIWLKGLRTNCPKSTRRYSSYICGPDCGSSQLLYWTKVRGQWIVEDEMILVVR